jgi:hypothetical protein
MAYDVTEETERLANAIYIAAVPHMPRVSKVCAKGRYVTLEIDGHPLTFAYLAEGVYGVDPFDSHAAICSFQSKGLYSVVCKSVASFNVASNRKYKNEFQ